MVHHPYRRVIEVCNKLPGEVVESLSSELLKIQLGIVLGNLLYLTLP